MASRESKTGSNRPSCTFLVGTKRLYLRVPDRRMVGWSLGWTYGNQLFFRPTKNGIPCTHTLCTALFSKGDARAFPALRFFRSAKAIVYDRRHFTFSTF